MRQNLLTIVMLMISAFMSSAIAQIRTPVLSPPAKTYSQVGLTDITVDYFRPLKKDRKIFGEGSEYLVPFGQIWRTGANTGTKVTFSDDVKIMGTDIAAGEYLMFTIPGKSSWEVMLYKDLSLGANTQNYDKGQEAGRWTITPSQTSETTEAFTVMIEDITENYDKAHIAVMWENTKVELPVSVSFHERVMASIEQGTRVNPNNYAAAANYYYQSDEDLDQALKWINMYLAERNTAFWNIHLKAKILAKMGRKKEAIETAQKSMELAKASGNDFGYVKLNEDLIASLK